MMLLSQRGNFIVVLLSGYLPRTRPEEGKDVEGDEDKRNDHDDHSDGRAISEVAELLKLDENVQAEILCRVAGCAVGESTDQVKCLPGLNRTQDECYDESGPQQRQEYVPEGLPGRCPFNAHHLVNVF